MSNNGNRYQESPERPRRGRPQPPKSNGTAPPASKPASRKPFSYADALSNPKPASAAAAVASSRSGKSEPLRVRTRIPTRSNDSSKRGGKDHRKKSDRRKVQITKIIEKFPHLASLNQKSFNPHPKRAIFFVIKSYGEDDVHKSIKYGLWSSTPKGNRKLDARFDETAQRYGENHRSACPIYLLFSVNQSKCFCGLARMETRVDFDRSFHAWAQDGKWTGHFGVRWLFIKDIPNGALRKITLPNNEQKPVTFSRDTQEVPITQGRACLKIFSTYRPKTSILDDFGYYDGRQADMEKERAEQKKREEDEKRRQMEVARERERKRIEENGGEANANPPTYYEEAPPLDFGDDTFNEYEFVDLDAREAAASADAEKPPPGDLYYYGSEPPLNDTGMAYRTEDYGFDAPPPPQPAGPPVSQPPPPVMRVSSSGHPSQQTSFEHSYHHEEQGTAEVPVSSPNRTQHHHHQSIAQPLAPPMMTQTRVPPPPQTINNAVAVAPRPPPPPLPPPQRQGPIVSTPTTNVPRTQILFTAPTGLPPTSGGAPINYYQNGGLPLSSSATPAGPRQIAIAGSQTTTGGIGSAPVPPQQPMSWADRAARDASRTTAPAPVRSVGGGTPQHQQQGYVPYGSSVAGQAVAQPFPMGMGYPQVNPSRQMNQMSQGYSSNSVYYNTQQPPQYNPAQPQW